MTDSELVERLRAPMLIPSLSLCRDAASRIAQLAVEVEQAKQERNEARALSYVPGIWKCAKCNLEILSTDLSPSGHFANQEPHQCLNKCGPMWRVSERNQRQEAQRLFEQEFNRRVEAEAALAEERKIVDRIWAIFGTPSFEELQGKTIYDLVRAAQTESQELQVKFAEAQAERDNVAKELANAHMQWAASVAAAERGALERAAAAAVIVMTKMHGSRTAWMVQQAILALAERKEQV